MRRFPPEYDFRSTKHAVFTVFFNEIDIFSLNLTGESDFFNSIYKFAQKPFYGWFLIRFE